LPKSSASMASKRGAMGLVSLPMAMVSLLLISFILLECSLPLRTALQIGADEGFEVAKATLWIKGHHLYTEIWNDQPPLHTFLLTCILKYSSSTMLGPRLLTVFFAGVLIGSVFFIANRVSGVWVATITGALLVAAPGFLGLSSSCMLEIPSLATAVLALSILQSRPPGTRRYVPELLSAVTFGAALQMKLVPAIYLALVPLVMWLCQRADKENPKKIFISLLLYGAALTTSYVLIDLAIEHGAYLRHFEQSWASHFGGSKSIEYGSAQDYPFDWRILLKNWDIIIPALLGIFELWRRIRKGEIVFVFPIGWLALTMAVFILHKPWWPYYYVHLAIPLCWCAAVGLCALGRLSVLHRSKGIMAVLAIFTLCSLPWMGARLFVQATDIWHSPQIYSAPVLQQIARFKPFSEWLYADRQIYSFYSGIPMPPNLAVLPVKRFWAGEMTNQKLTECLATLKPGLLLLENDTRERPFQKLLQTDYRLVYVDAQFRLYAHSSIAKKVPFWSNIPSPRSIPDLAQKGLSPAGTDPRFWDRTGGPPRSPPGGGRPSLSRCRLGAGVQ
jgi:4-amino-4-deoxy-L-arabinose transferase-like glycosyltransferase